MSKRWEKLVPDCESALCLQIQTADTDDFVLLRESVRANEIIVTSKTNLSAVIVAAKAGKLDHLIVGG